MNICYIVCKFCVTVCSFNRVLLSKALLCDGLPEEILMFTTKNLTFVKFEHQISEGTYHIYGLRQKDSIVFVVQC